jgi:hypothetical protein
MGKISVLYRLDSEHESLVREYQREYQKRTGRQIALLDLESEEGESLAKTIGAIRYPAVVAMSDDGSRFLQLWQGEPLPLINEVSFYDSLS